VPLQPLDGFGAGGLDRARAGQKLAGGESVAGARTDDPVDRQPVCLLEAYDRGAGQRPKPAVHRAG
jgi:hypothetical protein